MKRARDELPAPAVANANGDGNEPAIDDSPSAKRPRCSDEHRDDPLPQPLMLALHARLARRSSHDNNDDNDEHRELQQIRIVERDGQRFIEPYYHVFRAFVKRRWHLRTAQQVFSAEFHAFPSDYWPLAFEHRRIGVNGSPISPDTVLRESDALTHIVHRHERAITTDKIRILLQHTELVVVDKPASIPVHPCGMYHHNSLTQMLARDHGLPQLSPLHRLDAPVSGIVILARSKAFAQRFAMLMRNREIHKEYLARVIGRFPPGQVKCDAPVGMSDFKSGIGSVGGLDGKESVTLFEAMHYDAESNTSIVRCLPQSGRRHQIRVHLQKLGHPIANDRIYCTTSTDAVSDALPSPPPLQTPDVEDTDEPPYVRDPICPTCQGRSSSSSNTTAATSSATPDEPGSIYLHALRYTLPVALIPTGLGGQVVDERGWHIETPTPSWAQLSTQSQGAS